MPDNNNTNGNKALYWGFGGFAALTFIGFFILVVGFLVFLVVDAKNDAQKNNPQEIISNHENNRKTLITEEDLRREKYLKEDDLRREKIKNDMMDEMQALSVFNKPQYVYPPCNTCPEEKEKTKVIVRNNTRYYPQYPQLPQQQVVQQDDAWKDYARTNDGKWADNDKKWEDNGKRWDANDKNWDKNFSILENIQNQRNNQKQHFQPKQEKDEEEWHNTEE